MRDVVVPVRPHAVRGDADVRIGAEQVRVLDAREVLREVVALGVRERIRSRIRSKVIGRCREVREAVACPAAERDGLHDVAVAEIPAAREERFGSIARVTTVAVRLLSRRSAVEREARRQQPGRVLDAAAIRVERSALELHVSASARTGEAHRLHRERAGIRRDAVRARPDTALQLDRLAGCSSGRESSRSRRSDLPDRSAEFRRA